MKTQQPLKAAPPQSISQPQTQSSSQIQRPPQVKSSPQITNSSNRSNSFSNVPAKQPAYRDFYQPTPGLFYITKNAFLFKKKLTLKLDLNWIATAVSSHEKKDLDVKQWFKEVKKTHQKKQD